MTNFLRSMLNDQLGWRAGLVWRDNNQESLIKLREEFRPTLLLTSNYYYIGFFFFFFFFFYLTGCLLFDMLLYLIVSLN